MNESETNPTDHRSRVGADRRAKTRDLLMRTGLALVAETGIFGFGIDDVIRRASVARGTFYTHYPTTEALVRDVAQALAEELIVTVNSVVQHEVDPACRAAFGLRAVLHLARQAPVLAGFVSRAGWPHSDPGHAFHRLVVPNLQAGLAQGRFQLSDGLIGAYLTGGLTIGAMHAMESGLAGPDFAEAMAETLLIGLGLDRAEATKIARIPLHLPDLPVGGLIASTKN